MSRFLFLFTLLLGAAASAQTLFPCTSACPTRFYWEVQASSPATAGIVTRAAPTATPTANAPLGMSLLNVKGARLNVCAPAGQLLDGTGNMRVWLFYTPGGVWIRSPELDVEVTATTRCQAWPDWVTGVSLPSWILFAADGVGLSGTATTPSEEDTLVVRLDGQL